MGVRLTGRLKKLEALARREQDRDDGDREPEAEWARFHALASALHRAGVFDGDQEYAAAVAALHAPGAGPEAGRRWFHLVLDWVEWHQMSCAWRTLLLHPNDRLDRITDEELARYREAFRRSRAAKEPAGAAQGIRSIPPTAAVCFPGPTSAC
jgi:hypothetical protein